MFGLNIVTYCKTSGDLSLSCNPSAKKQMEATVACLRVTGR